MYIIILKFSNYITYATATCIYTFVIHVQLKAEIRFVAVLEKYEVVVTALQKTKWFGNNVYSVGRSLVLTSGRPSPFH